MSNTNFLSIERVRAPVLSLFEHKHPRALDIRTSSGTNIKYIVLLWSKILKTFVCSASISECLALIRTWSEHKRTNNDNLELRVSTNAHFSEREWVSIEPFEVRHNTRKKLVGLDLLYFIRHGCWVNVRAFCPVFYEPLSDQQFLSINMYTQRSPLSIMHCWELSQYHTLSPIFLGSGCICSYTIYIREIGYLTDSKKVTITTIPWPME